MFTNTIQIFDSDLIVKAIEYCRSKLPYESGGIFTDHNFIPFENESDTPSNKYYINNPDFYYLLSQEKIKCLIHSHNNYPHSSIDDQRAQKDFDIPFCIINFRNGTCEHVIFWGNDIPKEPLIGRPFFFGVFDCLTLSADYIFNKYNKQVPTPDRDVDYWKYNQSLFEDTVSDKEYPIDFIDKDDITIDDFLFYKFDSKYINHVGTLMDNGRILHHFMGKKSCILPKSYFKKNIVAAGRFNIDWEC